MTSPAFITTNDAGSQPNMSYVTTPTKFPAGKSNEIFNLSLGRIAYRYSTDLSGNDPHLNIDIVSSQQQAAPQATQKTEVGGTVQGFNEVSVICKLHASTEIELRLPRSIFVDDVFHGMPMVLSIIDRNGIRTPVAKRDTSAVNIPGDEQAAWNRLLSEI